MRRSRLLLIALLNILGLIIVAWKFVTMGSLANLYGAAALSLFVAAFIVLRLERRRAALEKSQPN